MKRFIDRAVGAYFFGPPCMAVRLQNRQKVGFLTWFVGVGIPQISDMHFQIALTVEHLAGFGRVPFSDLRGQREKKETEEEKLKPKSADTYMYVGRLNRNYCWHENSLNSIS